MASGLLPLCQESRKQSLEDSLLSSSDPLAHSLPQIPCSSRFLDRSGNYRQSRGRLNIQRKNGPAILWTQGLIHSILHKDTKLLVLGVFCLYLGVFLLFAPFFWLVRDECKLELKHPLDAVFLSMETMLTIGYGVPENYWNHCYSGFFLVALQSVLSILLDAAIIGVFFARIARPQNRASTIIFSDKAIINHIRGAYYLMFQVCELRKHQIVEAHVRCYSIRRSPTFAAQSMRLQRPDDELGGMVLLAVPTVIVHRIDAWSPLAPPQCHEINQPHDPSSSYHFPDVPQRACDVENGNREIRGGNDQVLSREQIENWLSESQSEVIVLLEGQEQITGSGVQARHSYSAEDIVWNCSFAPCISPSSDGGCTIDFSVFHDVEPRADIPHDSHSHA